MLRKLMITMVALLLSACSTSTPIPTQTIEATQLPTQVEGQEVNVKEEDVFGEILRQIDVLQNSPSLMHVSYQNELDNFKIISDASLTKDDVIENKLTHAQSDALSAYKQALVDLNKKIVALFKDNDFENIDALTSKKEPLIKIDHIKHHSLEYTLTLYEDGFIECTSDTSTQYLKSETVASDATLVSIKEALENLPLTLIVTVSNTEKVIEGCSHGYPYGDDVKYMHVAKYTYTDNEGNSFVSGIVHETFFIKCIGFN